MKVSLDRRRVLRGLVAGSAVSVGLPRLEVMLDGHGLAYANGQPLPKRFGVWAFANGVHSDRWVPTRTGVGDEWQLSEQLRPLARIKPYLSVVSGTTLPFDGRPHAAGAGVLMTGAPLGGSTDNTFTVRRASIDQLVARQVGHATAFRSLELGVDASASPEKGTAFHWWSHNGPGSPNPCSYDCGQVFDRLFGRRPESAVQLADQRSILDAVMADTRDLTRMLGARDRMRLDQHLDGVRALEKQLSFRPPVGCVPPPRPADGLVGPHNAVDYQPGGTEVNRTMAQLLALALACDLTRVFTFQLLKPGSRVGLRSLGFSLYHDITHKEPGDQPKCNAAVTFFMNELAVLIETLRAVSEGAGNLLDGCAIMASTDCTHPKTHGRTDYPLLVIGRGGGTLRSNLHYQSRTNENSCRVPLTLARAVGANLSEMGEGPGRATESLGALLV